MAEVKVKSGGVGFCGLLGLLFIGLKLTGYITWSWWLVLLPLYAGLALVVGIPVLFMCMVAAVGFIVGTFIWLWKKFTGKPEKPGVPAC